MKNIWIFRIVAFALLVFLATKPVMVRPELSQGQGWSFLIDTSASMRVKDPAERLSQAKEAFEKLASRVPKAKLFQFSDAPVPLDRKDVAGLTPTGKKSDLAAALQAAVIETPVRGAAVVTDGRNVGDKDPIAVAASAGKPLFLIGVGDRSLFRDVSVTGVQSPPFAFKNISVALSATVSVVGYPNRPVAVTLKEGGAVLDTQKINVSASEAQATVTFSWVPSSVGTKVLSVQAEPQTGEVTTLNNKKEITLDVGRDRFRVLYICGEPGPEYGFLRHQFKADPAVELVTFVILRNASNTTNIPDHELALIPFPTQDVLINQINTFDLVVFEEFSYPQYGLSPALVAAIRQKVQNGGSFLLMGGPVTFGVGSAYAVNGIRDMIPVEVGLPETMTTDREAPFIVKAPAHPIFRMEENAERNRALWEGVPPLDGVTLVPAAKPGASVLGVCAVNGREYPVLTVWKFGKGRVAALTARTTWRWSMVTGGKQFSSDVYQRFWKNMVVWLTHSDEFKPVRVALENKQVRLGETQTARVWVVDDYFKPVSDVDVRMEVAHADGTTENLAPHAETAGVWRATFVPRALGEATVTAGVLRQGKRFGSDTIRFRVLDNVSEEEDLRPDFDFLKELAQASGGQFIPAGQFSTRAFDDFAQTFASSRGRKILLWNSPWFFAVLFLVLTVEWTWRRLKGLP